MQFEYLALVSAVYSFLCKIRGHTVMIWCDNTAVVGGCSKRYTGHGYLHKYVTAFVNATVYDLAYVTVGYIHTPPKETSESYTAPHLWQGDDNRLADSLSRFQLDDFRACCKAYRPNEYSSHESLTPKQ